MLGWRILGAALGVGVVEAAQGSFAGPVHNLGLVPLVCGRQTWTGLGPLVAATKRATSSSSIAHQHPALSGIARQPKAASRNTAALQLLAVHC